MILALWDNPAVVGLIIGAPMAVLGFLGWWRSREIDETAKEAKSGRIYTSEAGDLWDEGRSIRAELRAEVAALKEFIFRQEKEIRELLKMKEECLGELKSLKAGVALVQKSLEGAASAATVSTDAAAAAEAAVEEVKGAAAGNGET